MLRIQEKILLIQIKNGNQKAFATFYDIYQKRIYRFIYFKVSNEEKAKDLTNDVFIKIYDYIKQGNIINNFRAFLYRTARNLVIDFYRTKRDAISLDKTLEIIDRRDINEQVDNKIAVDNIKKQLSFLKPEYQEVVRLRLFEGLSFKEIAKITGQKEATLRMQSHRGIKQLKENLSKK